MLYTAEVLNRRTGSLDTVELGDWLTVSELAKQIGVGKKVFRAVLHHMGLLAAEKGRYRLPRSGVEKGFGQRHDKPKSGYPFDAISPLGQQLIQACWEDTYADYELELRADKRVDTARQGLATFKEGRLRPMQTKEEVYWVLDHFVDITLDAAARAIEVDRALVSRYAARRSREKRFWAERRRYCGEGPAPAVAVKGEPLSDYSVLFEGEPQRHRARELHGVRLARFADANARMGYGRRTACPVAAAGPSAA